MKEFTTKSKKCNLVKLALLLGYLEYDVLLVATGDFDRLWQFAIRCNKPLYNEMMSLVDLREWDNEEKMVFSASSSFNVVFRHRCLKVLDPGRVLNIAETVISAQKGSLPNNY